jgi:hypothetical protein
VLALLVLSGAGASCGLHSKGQGGTGDADRISTIEVACPFAPVALMIHPLTRVVPGQQQAGARLEVYIDLRDRFGDEVKGLGDLAVELLEDGGPIAGVGQQRQLALWRFDLNDLEANDRAYDPITRTYRIDLANAPEGAAGTRDGAGGRVLIRATLTAPTGKQLVGELRL